MACNALDALMYRCGSNEAEFSDFYDNWLSKLNFPLCICSMAYLRKFLAFAKSSQRTWDEQRARAWLVCENITETTTIVWQLLLITTIHWRHTTYVNMRSYTRSEDWQNWVCAMNCSLARQRVQPTD